MTRHYETTFRESGTGRTLVLRGQGNTRTSGARAARWQLRRIVGDMSGWYEVETHFVPQKEAR